MLDYITSLSNYFAKFVSDSNLDKSVQNLIISKGLLGAINSIGFIGPEGIGRPGDGIFEVYRGNDEEILNFPEDATGVKVAVLDTGANHGKITDSGSVIGPKLADKSEFVNFSDLKNIKDTTDDFIFAEHKPEIRGHGTGVAGIISSIESTAGNSISVVKNAEIFPIKVCDKEGTCLDLSVVLGLCHAYATKVDVINLSLGSLLNSPIIEGAVSDVINGGILIVASAGNTRETKVSGESRRPVISVKPYQYCTKAVKVDPDYDHWRYNCPVFPAAFSKPGSDDGLMSVGSVGIRRKPVWIGDFFNSYPYSYFSTVSPTVDIVAPGEAIRTYSTTANTSVLVVDTIHSGTSFAAPHVSGAAAAVIAARAKGGKEKYSPAQLEKLLKSTARREYTSRQLDPFDNFIDFPLCVPDLNSELSPGACMVSVPNAVKAATAP
jgi:subtilisin family serine protease